MKNKLILMFLGVISLLGIYEKSYAQSSIHKSTYSREIPRIVTSVRAMGMGGAYYGVSNDKYAPFYNPAGLGLNKNKWQFEFPIALNIGLDHDLLTNAQNITNIFKNSDTGEITKLLDTMMGDYNSVSPITFFPAIVKKAGASNFTIGLFVNSQVGFLAYNNVNPELMVSAKADAGLTVGYSYSFLEDESLHFGVSVMGLYRMAYETGYQATELAGINFSDLLKDVLNNKGWGIYGSVGLMYELPWLRDVLNARVGVSFNDFGYQDFAPGLDKIDPTLNLSVAISPNWNFISSNVVFDFTDILLMSGKDKDFGKRFNIGLEIGFWDRIFLRTGLHQGYVTAGAGIDLWLLRLNYAYYTEEMGAYPGNAPDARHVLELNIGWTKK